MRGIERERKEFLSRARAEDRFSVYGTLADFVCEGVCIGVSVDYFSYRLVDFAEKKIKLARSP